MAEDPEALTQLSRLLADAGLRSAARDEIGRAVDGRFDLLVEGLLTEATASDDVADRDSALGFVRQRLERFGDLMSAEQRSRLIAAVQAKIEAW
jgi:hypothetical protein